MKITYYPRPALLGWLVLVLALLVGGACVPENMVVSPPGMVVVGAGEDIQIRSLEALTGIGSSEAAGGGDGAGGLRADRGT